MTRAMDLFQLGHAQGQEKTVLGRLVSNGISTVLCERLMVIAPDLLVQNGNRFQVQEDMFASYGQVQQLIQVLLDDGGERSLRGGAIDHERGKDNLLYQAERKQRWLLGPLLDLSEARRLQSRQVDRNAAEAENVTDVRRVLASTSATPQAAGMVNFEPIYGGSYKTGLNRYFESEWRAVAERRAAAISLAIQLFRGGHENEWPESLEELVPTYLPAVPVDPLQSGCPPIGYVVRKNALPNGSERPMLYFGVAGTDPQRTVLPSAPSFDWNERGPQWRDLSRWYPATNPPSAPGR